MATTSLVVLCPNGRRETVKVSPNNSILQILEDVCHKYGLKPEEFALKHLNRLLDLSNSIRFSNLPNNALLELVPEKKVRTETSVTLVLQLESGDRLLRDFPPSTTLWDIISYWEQEKSVTLVPTQENLEAVCVYMRNEIAGEEKLKATSLRNLGLINGKAIIRLIKRQANSVRSQAHVAAPLTRSAPQKQSEDDDLLSQSKSSAEISKSSSTGFESTSSSSLSHVQTSAAQVVAKPESNIGNGSSNQNKTLRISFVDRSSKSPDKKVEVSEKMEIDASPSTIPKVRQTGKKTQPSSNSSNMPVSNTIAADRIIMLGERKALVYSLDDIQRPIEDLPDDFFDVTLDDVKYLFADLKRQRQQLESATLQTRAMKMVGQKSKKEKYVHTTIRVQFPDRLVLQGQFKTKEKVSDIIDFVRTYLNDKSKPFHLYTTPPKHILNPSDDLMEALLVPKAVVHFGSDSPEGNCLEKALRNKLSTPNAAATVTCSPSPKPIHDNKPTSSSNNEVEEMITSSPQSPKETSPPRDRKASGESSKSVPKWFNIGKKK